MKTIEEKAKAYDEALAKAKEQYNYPCMRSCMGILEEIFPELKESEDEKIRKWIINEIKIKHHNLDEENVDFVDKAIAWVEKQGEERKITHEEICKSYGIPDIGEFSDGYHTFNGLYKQRMILFAVLVKTYKDRAWKSWKHEDGLDCFGGGWFIVGIDTPAGTYTYHYEAKDWDRFDCQILEKAKHWDGHDESDVERLFSLVSNANKDEVIRCLINGMKFYYEDNEEATWGTQKFSMKVKDILSWLEKQGEQKPADKVEPKFKVGDWINGYYTSYKVLSVNNEGYVVEDTDGNKINILFENEKFHHLWTIRDAKDGDVLAGSYGTFILMGKSNGGYCGVLNDNTFIRSTGNNEWTENLHPATKEQRDLLFKTMEEAGYEWDTEKKELKKIAEELQLKEGKYYECIKSYHYLGCGEYWFDEGKVYFCEKDGYLRSDPNNLIYVYDCENWQSYFRPYAEKLAWNEEDEQRLNSCLNILQPKTFVGNTETINTKWLKSLKDRVQPQPKQEWSEEEIEKAAQEWELKANFNPFYMTMDGDKPTGVKQDITTHKESFKAGVNWILKSLRPQNRWKPSELQLGCLSDAIEHYNSLGYPAPKLKELLDDLKKLKEGKV